jgi:glycosyltransferase involved in cell wall biosynthesis
MTGRMVRSKGFDTFVSAAVQLHSRQPGKWQFVLLGSGPELPRIESMAAGLVREGILTVADGGLDVMPLVADCDIGVLMTRPDLHREGCSNSIMEYMLAGLPVVCTDSGANRELVTEGLTGLLIDPRSDNLMEALELLARDDETRVGMGAHGRKHILSRYSVEMMATRTAALYDSEIGALSRSADRRHAVP